MGVCDMENIFLERRGMEWTLQGCGLLDAAAVVFAGGCAVRNHQGSSLGWFSALH